MMPQPQNHNFVSRRPQNLQIFCQSAAEWRPLMTPQKNTNCSHQGFSYLTEYLTFLIQFCFESETKFTFIHGNYPHSTWDKHTSKCNPHTLIWRFIWLCGCFFSLKIFFDWFTFLEDDPEQPCLVILLFLSTHHRKTSFSFLIEVLCSSK